jgi:hypothetical protein
MSTRMFTSMFTRDESRMWPPIAFSNHLCFLRFPLWFFCLFLWVRRARPTHPLSLFTLFSCRLGPVWLVSLSYWGGSPRLSGIKE